MMATLAVTVKAGLSEEVMFRQDEEPAMWRAGCGEFRAQCKGPETGRHRARTRAMSGLRGRGGGWSKGDSTINGEH